MDKKPKEGMHVQHGETSQDDVLNKVNATFDQMVRDVKELVSDRPKTE
ncbi:hypothetical protein [Bacillus thermotolerans]|uniref:Uncharacterized protein n=1 Tax=Bacillus thermotolerans TaxID=1221996 RepID=A0A0F5HZY6_BACTR|nr:hypothetical protein [Bacillus thermotolerans]KKB38823.1 hypothetical protein QY97_01066 [Bacillus thermotolerans]KKB42509.1 hypothetical protein QY95_00358 [Bacillus thermotolerans]KKB44544.1 hypothetical protein QY96_02164 [Bacillus thermotolerans]